MRTQDVLRRWGQIATPTPLLHHHLRHVHHHHHFLPNHHHPNNQHHHRNYSNRTTTITTSTSNHQHHPQHYSNTTTTITPTSTTIITTTTRLLYYDNHHGSNINPITSTDIPTTDNNEPHRPRQRRQPGVVVVATLMSQRPLVRTTGGAVRVPQTPLLGWSDHAAKLF
ncbi:unnamed protein product [Gadus morhua 'NCC']